MSPHEPFQFKFFMENLWYSLITYSWPWWSAGAGLGLTALGLAWFTGRRLGVTGGFEDACSVIAKDENGFNVSPSRWKLWFILGLPLGGFLAHIGNWGWTFLFGRLDSVLFGSFFLKALWLLAAGFLIGFGARWAGGCTSGHSIMGISLGSKMSILATLAFLTAGILITNILFKAL